MRPPYLVPDGPALTDRVFRVMKRMVMKPSVCIDAVLEGRPLEDSLRCVADCGYQAFEFWKWWEKDLVELLRLRDLLGLQVAACCTKFESLVDPKSLGAYLKGLEASISAAQRLGCRVLISQVGDALDGVSREKQREQLVEGLRQAARLLEGSGVILAIEPLNELVDHAGYYLIRSDEAFDIVGQVASPSVKVTFDIYHQQISEGHLIDHIVNNIEHIAHFHAAGNPGRHELGTGEIHYPAVFEAIRKTNFDGFVGLEYWPLSEVTVGLKAARQLF